MEPVFMVLGQSSAVIACLAIEEDKAVQEIDYNGIRKMLIKQAQVLE
jgi:hypothetical protein